MDRAPPCPAPLTTQCPWGLGGHVAVWTQLARCLVPQRPWCGWPARRSVLLGWIFGLAVLPELSSPCLVLHLPTRELSGDRESSGTSRRRRRGRAYKSTGESKRRTRVAHAVLPQDFTAGPVGHVAGLLMDTCQLPEPVETRRTCRRCGPEHGQRAGSPGCNPTSSSRVPSCGHSTPSGLCEKWGSGAKLESKSHWPRIPTCGFLCPRRALGRSQRVHVSPASVPHVEF